MDWNLVEDLFHRLTEEGPEERQRLLAGHPVDVRSAVEELLTCARDGSAIENTIRRAAFLALKPEGLAGPYQLVRQLGSGGMGTVYLGQRADDLIEKRVAIKFVHQAMDSPLLRRRFEEERRILARLEHPCIARLLDAGATPDGRPWLAMEYVEGDDISSYVRTRNLPLRARIELLIQVCEAVQYANQNLVVHRDLKPGNVLIGADGVPKLLDFGIAKLMDLDTQSTGPTMLRLLTPEYASPEQLRGEGVTTATDVYSLGAMLFEILTGDKPFHLDRVTPHDAERLITAGITERPSQRNTAWRQRLEGDLDNIVLKAMRPESRDRYASARELAEDLRRYLNGQPVTARDYTAWQRFAKTLSRHRAASLAVGTTAAVLITASIVSARFAIRAENARQMAAAERQTAQQQKALAEQQRTVADQQRKEAEQQRALAEEGHRAATAGQRLAEQRLHAQEADLARVVDDFYTQIAALPGSTPARLKMLESSIAQLERLLKESPSATGPRTTLAAAYFEMGKLYGSGTAASLGDGQRGLDYMNRSLQLREVLFHERPMDEHAAWAVAVTSTELGRYYDNRGDLQTADRYLDRAGSVAEQYLAMKPQNPQSTLLVANLYITRGLLRMNRKGLDPRVEPDLARAESLVPVVDAASQDAKQIQLRSQVESMRGQYFFTRQDWKAAMPPLEEALELRERLLRMTPHDTSIMRMVMMSHSYIAHAAQEWEGPTSPRVLTANEKMVQMAEQLAAADPANRTAQYDLAMSQNRLAQTLVAAGDIRGALPPAERSIRIFRQLRAAGDQDVAHLRNFGASLNTLAEIDSRLGRTSEAQPLYQEAFGLAEKELARNARDFFSLRWGALAAANLAAGSDGAEAVRYASTAVDLVERAASTSGSAGLNSLAARVYGEAALAFDKAAAAGADAALHSRARELAAHCVRELAKVAPGAAPPWSEERRNRLLALARSQ